MIGLLLQHVVFGCVPFGFHREPYELFKTAFMSNVDGRQVLVMEETLQILILLYIRRKVEYFEFHDFFRKMVWTSLRAFCNSGI